MNLSTGGITFTGSIVAFLKLAGRMSSRPIVLPGRHLINTSLLGANALSMAGFLSMAPSTPAIAAAFLGTNAVLSFIKGYTTTAAVGGADMRAFGTAVYSIFKPECAFRSCRDHRSKCIFGLRYCRGRYVLSLS